MSLNTQVQMLLKELAKQPPLYELSPAEARDSRTKMYEGFPEPQSEARVMERHIVYQGIEIKVRIYMPKGEGPFPALVYYHGGGWVLGLVPPHDALCRVISDISRCVVVSVDYRLAPEHKFPSSLEDAWSSLKWVWENSADLNIDPHQIAVGGDSSGGNLAAVVAQRARDLGMPEVMYQVLIYPVTHYSFETPSYWENAEGYFLTRATMQWFWNHYLEKEEDGFAPDASPLLAENLEGLPAALVITAEYDPLRDEGEAYAEKLKKAGVPTRLSRYDGMIHGFVTMSHVLDDGRKAAEEIGLALKEAFVANKKRSGQD